MKNKTIGILLGMLFILPIGVKAANTNAQEYEDQGMALYNRGMYEKSVQYFNMAVQADPTDGQAYQEMGDAYFKLNDHPNALDSYQKALKLDPNNQALQVKVENLQGGSDNGNPPPQPAASAPGGDQGWDQSEQPSTVIVRRHRPRAFAPSYSYGDGLSPIDHSKVWTKVFLNYNYSTQADLINGATGVNQEVAANPPLTGSGTMTNNGFGTGVELGFLLNKNNGIALGLKYIRSDDYTLSENANNGSATMNSDYEDLTLQSYVIPLTLDYYFFIPDGSGRFYLSGGVGYYFGVEHVDQSFSSGGSSNGQVGDLTAGAPGFQFGIGREFAIGNRMGITLFGSYRYAKMTNFRGTLYDSFGNAGNFGLAKFGNDYNIVDVDNTGNIGGNNESYANVDFSGFDIGVALSFYSF